MKKLFLIPLLTLVCSVMAWGATITVGEGGDQTSLAAAINAASAGDKLQLVSNLTVSSEVNFNKALTVDFNSYTITATGNWLIVVNANLTLEATNGGGITAPKGCLDVYGSSKVTINGGTLSTSITNSGAAIWGNGSSCELEFNNGTINAQSAGIVYEGGRVIINGGNFNGEYGGALEVRGGYFEINDGEFISHCSTTHMGNNWAYAVIADNCTFVMNGGHIEGVQGGLSIGEGANGTINDGEFETRYGVDGKDNNHYALYVSTLAMVNVYGGKYKVETPNENGGKGKVILIDDNDAGTTYGIINLYGGTFQQKAQVTHKQAHDLDMAFPPSVPSTSQWYSSFGSYAPLPAGYEYYEITEGEDYEAGYRFGVRVIPGTETAEVEVPADPTATIPWQQNTTWDATADPSAEGIVPEDNTIVTIPVGATVVVSNAAEDVAAGGDEAEAKQIFVSQGATLKVEEGTKLTVGEGGVNIGNGGQIVIEPGAIVTVGDAGMVTTEEKALVIESTEENQGVFLLKPEVTENTQPKATVKMVTKCKQIDANEFVWERFAIPTLDGEGTTYSIEGGTTGIVTYDGGAFKQGLYGWSDEQQDWVGLARFKDMQPFKGYQLSNNSMNGGVTYVFEGNIVGNVDKNYEFAQSGFGFFGNSYTGDIDIKNFLNGFEDGMQKTIWVYDPYSDQFKAVTLSTYGSVYYGKRGDSHGLITDIRSMQAFLMNTFNEGESSTSIDYASAIWGNPKYGLTSTSNPAPKRVAADEDMFTVYVAGAKQEDEVTFIRSNDYSAEFDNGADASKWMNNGLNLYVTTADGDFSSIASDEVVNMTIAFQAGNETEYKLGFDNLRGEQFELRDVVTGATILMTEDATYTFSQEANTTIPARFQVIGAPQVITGLDNAEGATVQQKVVKNGVLYILRDNKWYNAQGQLVE